ncbi:MAG: pyruvate, phosphate dikinase [Ilumatobacter sp.]|uniref:pyruvate, phosphate dikinase n=1 Tax=Ilumatobacter sp. TaxID=1967498 RepID=UPI003C72E2C9
MTDDLQTSPRWVYDFEDLAAATAAVGGDWDAVRGLLGGKGANLADMAAIGIPVPPGFTVTTEACIAYAERNELPDGLWEEVRSAVAQLEATSGKTFGGSETPLIVAVRSGAKFSMPGMMDTVLNVGLNDAVAATMIERTGDARFVNDSYRRLLQMFGSIVLGVDPSHFERVLHETRAENGVGSDNDLDAAALATLTERFRALISEFGSQPFPQDPEEQLRLATEAVFGSWHSQRAHDYREASGIDHDLGTAVNVVSMVFGNLGATSGTGVAMSRDGTTGVPVIEGDYLMNAQGEDVVDGSRPTIPLDRLATDSPECAAELGRIAKQLELHHRDMQDIEFTIEDGRLWLLQTRNGKRTAQAAVRIAVDMANEGLITREEAVQRVTPAQVDFFLHPQFSETELASRTPLAYGLNVSPGAAVGVAVFDPDIAVRWADQGRSVILVRQETKPDDVHGMLAAVGILTSSGGRTSHAALVARQFGKPAVTGAQDLVIDLQQRHLSIGNTIIEEGEWISIDGTTGTIYDGDVPTVDPDLSNDHLAMLLSWADDIRTLGVRANADDPVEAARARRHGAEGIGLCRTEHMFFAPDRLPIVQQMITAPTVGEQREAIEALLAPQRADFRGLFEVMDGLPVIIRLLDPPLHEFLPSGTELHHTISDLQIRLSHATDLATIESLVRELNETTTMLDRVDALSESNPMLGLRGVRLANRIPDLTRMQARAVVEAAVEVIRAGGNPMPEVMVPLVGIDRELKRQREIIEQVVAEVRAETGVEVHLPIGTMIEVPRAALTSKAIAAHADFISFGTNDLTQTTYAISRDDAESAFLLDYLNDGLLDANPFASIDPEGVGQLMQIGLDGARSTKPGLTAGVCGEHGGDPASIALCHEMGLDYVSCSAYRVPVARLAAAHARLA